MPKNYFFDQETRVWIRDNYVNRIPYSDGTEIEQRIFESVKNSKDVSVLSDELESHIFDWASLCFLSKRRSNLLRPFADYFKGKHILEPGCGAGPVTRFLGECGAYVYAVEPSIHRARIAAERCRDLDNVKVFCDDIEHFSIDQRFDGIIQVGVLEYATKYSSQANAPLAFINHLKQYLKEDGFLITAIENQLGLKYFSGFFEDHVGSVMYGINNNYQLGQVTTFGKEQLLHLFEQAGFGSNRLFLPFPDYKLPSLVVFPDLYEKNRTAGLNLQNILSNITYMDRQQSMPLFSMDKTLPLVAENGLLYDLSNSFCLLSQLKPVPAFDESILLTLYNTERRKEYCKETVFTSDNHSIKIERNYLQKKRIENEQVISFAQTEPVYEGSLYHYELVKIVNQEHWTIEQVTAWLQTWFDYLKQELNLQRGQAADITTAINSRYIDALPINMLMNGNQAHFIDLEIDLNQQVALGYVIFRAIYVSLSRLSSVAMPAQAAFTEADNIIYALFAGIGFKLTSTQLDTYYEQEAQVASRVAGVQIKTLKGSIQKLRTRHYINDPHGGHVQYVNGEGGQLQVAQLQDQLQRARDHIRQLDSHIEEKENHLTLLEKHVKGLNFEIHSLSTSRKRMLKQLLRRTFKIKRYSAD
jgi:SAM-dependent methyltransferase